MTTAGVAVGAADAKHGLETCTRGRRIVQSTS